MTERSVCRIDMAFVYVLAEDHGSLDLWIFDSLYCKIFFAALFLGMENTLARILVIRCDTLGESGRGSCSNARMLEGYDQQLVLGRLTQAKPSLASLLLPSMRHAHASSATSRLRSRVWVWAHQSVHAHSPFAQDNVDTVTAALYPMQRKVMTCAWPTDSEY